MKTIEQKSQTKLWYFLDKSQYMAHHALKSYDFSDANHKAIIDQFTAFRKAIDDIIKNEQA